MSKLNCTDKCQPKIKGDTISGFYAYCPIHKQSARLMGSEQAALAEWRRWLRIEQELEAAGPVKPRGR